MLKQQHAFGKIFLILKRRLIFLIFFSNEIHQKKSSADLSIFVAVCGKIQGQFVISTFKAQISVLPHLMSMHV